jgi:hypothetical protein
MPKNQLINTLKQQGLWQGDKQPDSEDPFHFFKMLLNRMYSEMDRAHEAFDIKPEEKAEMLGASWQTNRQKRQRRSTKESSSGKREKTPSILYNVVAADAEAPLQSADSDVLDMEAPLPSAATELALAAQDSDVPDIEAPLPSADDSGVPDIEAPAVNDLDLPSAPPSQLLEMAPESGDKPDDPHEIAPESGGKQRWKKVSSISRHSPKMAKFGVVKRTSIRGDSVTGNGLNC